jgi:K+-transporting ATPase A subunit
VGFLSLVTYAILAVFIVGLMVRRGRLAARYSGEQKP